MKALLTRFLDRLCRLMDGLQIDEICEKSPEVRVQMIINMMRSAEEFNSNFHP